MICRGLSVSVARIGDLSPVVSGAGEFLLKLVARRVGFVQSGPAESE
jgi:hypothetical protein